MNKTKPYQISKHVVLEAFRRVKANGGAAGVDGESLGICSKTPANGPTVGDAVSYTHLRAHETVLELVCRLLLEKKKNDASGHK